MPAPTTTAPQADNETIEYTADPQTLNITYIDDVTDKPISNLSTTVTGVTGQTGTINVQVPAGYVLTNPNDETITYTLVAGTNQVDVHVTHHVTHTMTTTTRTISYVIDGLTTAVQVPTVQTVTWNVSTDDVTGATVATAQGGYTAVKTPEIAGYTASVTEVAADNPKPTTDALTDSNVTVTYTPIPVVTPITPGDSQTTTEQPDGTVGNPTNPTTGEVEKGAAEKTANEVEKTSNYVKANDEISTDSDKTNVKITGNREVSGTQSDKTAELPQTDENSAQKWSIIGLGLLGLMNILGLSRIKKHE
ncbi:hypothetical protein FD04_GL001729 [Secundilactobacillus odoratitofui DSM 19909 = JCM 15043]|uniref:Mub B2-like domain-containing protein n=2 Tax=Secundilactobacillus odoratitofui TaxID=480930 RepID=A0A0R1LPB9_9LACO|nr:hypothetical protein FD04_GL001729 [Secundilactobacillus odoratitofui DSM 19909 = JCM 15043]